MTVKLNGKTPEEKVFRRQVTPSGLENLTRMIEAVPFELNVTGRDKVPYGMKQAAGVVNVLSGGRRQPLISVEEKIGFSTRGTFSMESFADVNWNPTQEGKALLLHIENLLGETSNREAAGVTPVSAFMTDRKYGRLSNEQAGFDLDYKRRLDYSKFDPNGLALNGSGRIG